MGKTEWGGTPVCWWLGSYFCFVCHLNEASCSGCYWWLGDAGSYIQAVSFVWVLIFWFCLVLVLWESRVLESVLPLQRLSVWSLVREEDYTSCLLDEIRTNTQKWEIKDKPQTNASYKIRQMTIKIIEYTHVHIHPWAKSILYNKNKVCRLTWQTKKIKNYIYQLRTKLTKAQCGKQN